MGIVDTSQFLCTYLIWTRYCCLHMIYYQHFHCYNGTKGAMDMAPSLLYCFSVVSMPWFTFSIVKIFSGLLTCILLATPLTTSLINIKTFLNPFYTLFIITVISHNVMVLVKVTFQNFFVCTALRIVHHYILKCHMIMVNISWSGHFSIFLCIVHYY